MSEALQEKSSLPPVVKKVQSVSVERLVVSACVASLLAMALMCWSVFDPTPFPVMVAMSVGQVVGTLGLVLYLLAIAVHGVQQRRRK